MIADIVGAIVEGVIEIAWRSIWDQRRRAPFPERPRTKNPVAARVRLAHVRRWAFEHGFTSNDEDSLQGVLDGHQVILCWAMPPSALNRFDLSIASNLPYRDPVRLVRGGAEITDADPLVTAARRLFLTTELDGAVQEIELTQTSIRVRFVDIAGPDLVHIVLAELTPLLHERAATPTGAEGAPYRR
ncbi:hypothetical protein AKJ09_01600 [Labilithrix luteola]|uniref:Uncharacterized protein n=1 Tax=Labilithrix luteola TaxID=1391654 RepID=A0A0K1PNG5_9BACT|nr:hypothetical protein [Labilithrix luteola]AKU94936.1 hypothetical protein AKJ09_01600 [Labilithrix luteola]